MAGPNGICLSSAITSFDLHLLPYLSDLASGIFIKTLGDNSRDRETYLLRKTLS